MLEDLKIIEYPEEWWSFEVERTHKRAENSIGLHAVFRNDGRTSAKNCTVHLISDRINNQQYRTRWSQQRQLTIDLSPNEKRKVDILWVDLENQTTKTGDSITISHGSNDPPGNYKKTSRPEISTGKHKLRAVVSADNMSESSFQLNISDKNHIEIPDDIIDNASEWNIITTVKNQSKEASIIKYQKGSEKILEIPDTLDITYLQKIDKFKKENIKKDSDKPYIDLVKNKYKIVRFK